MATSMLSLAPLAHAQTPAAPATCSITMSLTLGSTGAEVICLQAALVAKGYLVMPVGTQMGYFGALTQSAVAKWQAANGISPAAGYFGPISRAAFTGVATGGAMVPGCTSTTGYSTTTGQSCATATSLPAGCTSAMGFSPTTGVACNTTGTTPGVTGPLAGTDGNISDVTELGTYSNEEVGEGQDDVKVLGAEIEASNDGDIALKSVKVSFDLSGNGANSDNLDDYVSAVSVWLGSEKIGSANVDDFSESSSVFSKTITLSGKTTIKADDTENIYIAVDAVNTFDSGDIDNDVITVDLENIRFVDGSGVYTTETGYELGGMNVAVDFVSFSSAADTELKITTASASPEAGIVVVDDSSETENVSLLKGKLELEGTSDGVLDEFPVTFTANANGTDASANGVDDVVSSVTLKIGGKTYTETMIITSALTGSITFDNLDFAIDAGETVDFEVLADINDVDGTVFKSGMILKADVTSTNRNYIDIENEEGDQLSDSTEKSGTTNGEYQELRTNGIGLTLVSTATDATTGTNAGDDIGLFTIRFKVTAIGETMYVSSLANAVTGTTVTTGKTSIKIDRAGTATATNISVALVNTTDDDLNAAGLYEINEGDTETFEVTASVPMNASVTGQHRMSLVGVSWTTTSTDATPDNAYTSSLDTFKTSYKVLN